MIEGTEAPEKIIMYGSPTCPQVRPCRGILKRAGAAFEYVDIFKDADGRATVRRINNGYESVPTLVFPDGSTLTEPSGGQLKKKLTALGLSTRKPKPWESIAERPFLVILAAFALLFGFSDGNAVFLVISLLLFAFILIGGWLSS